MASFVKKILFGRQLSHGSDTENPQTFEEALQPPPLSVSNIDMPQQQVGSTLYHKSSS